MLLLYIGEDDVTKGYLDYHLTMLGYKVVQYKNPLKAMDNIEELLPDVVIFSSTDFPRHWKTFLQVYRQFMDREAGVFLLAVEHDFSSEEAAKAEFLQVNGILDNTFQEDITINQLKEILSRYSQIDEKRAFSRYIPDPKTDAVDFLFTHPDSHILVTGNVKDISKDTVSLKPDKGSQVIDLIQGMKLEKCSLTIGDELFTADCEILRNKEYISLKINSIAAHYEQVLYAYIDKRAERHLQKLVHNN